MLSGIGLTTPRRATGFLHTFTGANSAAATPAADTGEAAQVLAGTFGIDANRLYQAVDGGGNNNAIVWNVGVADLTLAMTVAVAGGNGARLVFRATDASNYFIVDCTGSAIEIYRRQAGAYTPNGSYAGGIANGDVISVALSGSGIVVRQNGTIRISTTDTFNQTATRHGVGFFSTGTSRVDTLQRTA